MTPEEKARISRENGAKSRGPKTDAGKAKSSRNAIKTGEYSDDLKHFVPPHEACVCVEDRDDYEALVDELMVIYKPVNRAAALAVGDIAAATWQVERLKKIITMTWNLSMVTNGARPNNFLPELHEVKTMVDATAEIINNGVLSKLNREVARLQQSIARAERRIKFIRTNFPDGGEQTQQERNDDVANKPLNSEPAENIENLQEPVYTTEYSKKVIDGYKRDFPGRPIVILPADLNPSDDEDEDDYRNIPRRAA